jgi:hypothetical protein
MALDLAYSFFEPEAGSEAPSQKKIPTYVANLNLTCAAELA